MINENDKKLELVHLSCTLQCIQDLLDNNEKSLSTNEEFVEQMNRYIRENPNLDANEISAVLHDSQDKVANTYDLIKAKELLTRVYNKPYFAKVKFICKDDPIQDYYFGIKGIWDDKGIYVVDWRSPIGSLYYDGNIGKASYKCPGGIIEGDLVCKRQFNIENSKLTYFFDSAINIDDDILQKALSKNTSNLMVNIVQTIQKEQNLVIREDKETNVVLDGVAGSGKTSIGMHRIAYLLFAYKNSINSNNILIISPNQLFTKYISNILPELGESNVRTCDLSTIFMLQLPRLSNIQNRNELVNDVLNGNVTRQLEAERKYSFVYYEKLKEFLAEKNDPSKLTKIKLLNAFINVNDIKKYYYHSGDFNIFKSASVTASRLVGFFAYQKSFKQQESLKKQLTQQIIANLIPNSLSDLVNEFFVKNGLYANYLNTKKIKNEDLSTFVFFNMYVNGFETDNNIKQIFIDELQDYDNTTLMLLKEIYPEARFTMVGDYNQNLLFSQTNKQSILDNYENSKLFKLENSYRSTINITNFGAKVLGKTFNTTFVRKGKEPTVNLCDSFDDRISKIKQKIKEYEQEGFKRIAIVCKNNEECNLLRDKFSDFSCITTEDNDIINIDKLIVSVLLAKGLEFDAVIIPDISINNYNEERERQVLYVACTRALHRLDLFYQGEKSKFIK